MALHRVARARAPLGEVNYNHVARTRTRLADADVLVRLHRCRAELDVAIRDAERRKLQKVKGGQSGSVSLEIRRKVAAERRAKGSDGEALTLRASLKTMGICCCAILRASASNLTTNGTAVGSEALPDDPASWPEREVRRSCGCGGPEHPQIERPSAYAFDTL